MEKNEAQNFVFGEFFFTNMMYAVGPSSPQGLFEWTLPIEKAPGDFCLDFGPSFRLKQFNK